MVPGRNLNPKLQRELRRANYLMAGGEHVNAARIFQSLAERARDLDIIYPAPMLFLRAAHAYLLGEDFDLSIQNAEAGLELLSAQERWVALKREGEGIIEDLETAGRGEQAHNLREWLNDALQGKTEELNTAEAGKIPEKCPYCGASMGLEQIEARAGKAAKCQYCASIVLPRK
jgi:hypothetical protein